MVDLNRILITGSQGMVGHAVSFGLKMSRHELDVTDPAQIDHALSTVNPTGVLSLASQNLRQSQADPYNALKINSFGALNMAEATARRNIPICLISTGAIFSGAPGTVFTEKDTPSPLNIYGQTKYLAEWMVTAANSKHIIVRTGWLFGGTSSHHLNFVDRIYASALKNEPIHATATQTGTPVFLPDFTQALTELIAHNRFGIFHVINDGIATALDIAHEITRLMGSRSKIVPVAANEALDPNVPRSQSEALSSATIRLRPWREALNDYLESKIKSGI